MSEIRCPTCHKLDDEPQGDCLDVWHLTNWCVKIEGEMTGEQVRDFLETISGKRRAN